MVRLFFIIGDLMRVKCWKLLFGCGRVIVVGLRWVVVVNFIGVCIVSVFMFVCFSVSVC